MIVIPTRWNYSKVLLTDHGVNKVVIMYSWPKELSMLWYRSSDTLAASVWTLEGMQHQPHKLQSQNVLIIYVIQHAPHILTCFERELVFRAMGLAVPACCTAIHEAKYEGSDMCLGGAE